MASHVGMSVLIHELAGTNRGGGIYGASIGKTIKSVELLNDELRFVFTDDTAMRVWDDGQSCCESRYMVTDDDLSQFAGTTFDGIEIKDAPDEEDTYGAHEVQFLEVKTGKGVFTMATHNEHNGYYGGFYVRCEPAPLP